LKYGTLPIVRLGGGLADAIEDGVNVFTFFDIAAHNFLDAVQRTINVYRKHPDRWKQMMLTAMGQDFSWEKSAEKYLAVYTKTLGEKGEFSSLRSQSE
jgi:starch synthase